MRKLRIVSLTSLALTSQAFAGMTAPVLTDIAKARFDAISFFLFVYFICAVVFRWLWNLLAKDFAWMPRLTLGRSVALLVVVGLFLYFLLTMISGARELMTPGAWARQGVGYRLQTPERDPQPWLDATRKQSLERLRSALWDYAAKHDGVLPAHPFASDFNHNAWRSAHPDGQWLTYIAGLALTGTPKVLVCEPASFGARRWALLTDGSVVQMEATELDERVKREFRP